MNNAEKISRLEAFLEHKINSGYFLSFVASFGELEDPEITDDLCSMYPQLAKGIDDPDEIRTFALDTYNQLHGSSLCPGL